MKTRWVLALVAVVVLAVASIAIAARGGGDDKTTNEGSNLSALRCPLEPTGKTNAGGTPEYRPAQNSFDTAELLGLPLEAARERAARGGCEIVVSVEDGAGQPVPIDIDPERIYVYTEKGVVTQIEGVGGGI